MWFGQGLVNRLWVAVTSSGDMGGAWCLLAKSLAGSSLGKAAAAWFGSGITPGLLFCLMSYVICHVPHGRWEIFRIN